MPGGGLQPHRKGSALRTPGPQLSAMLRGATLHGQNPTQQHRDVATMTAAGRKRAARSQRPARPPRSPRTPR